MVTVSNKCAPVEYVFGYFLYCYRVISVCFKFFRRNQGHKFLFPIGSAPKHPYWLMRLIDQVFTVQNVKILHFVTSMKTYRKILTRQNYEYRMWCPTNCHCESELRRMNSEGGQTVNLKKTSVSKSYTNTHQSVLLRCFEKDIRNRFSVGWQRELPLHVLL